MSELGIERKKTHYIVPKSKRDVSPDTVEDFNLIESYIHNGLAMAQISEDADKNPDTKRVIAIKDIVGPDGKIIHNKGEVIFYGDLKLNSEAIKDRKEAISAVRERTVYKQESVIAGRLNISKEKKAD